MQLVIEPGLASANYWRDLWRYRELMYFLAWRDIAVRYKQTAIGVVWALIRPALTMVVFVLFRRLMGNPSTGVPDPILVLAAVLPWQFFSAALSETSASLLGNTSLISKVYFPRLIIPVAAIATAFVDFAITLAMLAVLMAWYGVAPAAVAAGVAGLHRPDGTAVARTGPAARRLVGRYRDFRYVVPFIVQLGLVCLTGRLHLIAGARALARAVQPEPDGRPDRRLSLEHPGRARRRSTRPRWARPSVVTAAFVWLGVWYFRRVERGFADVI